jgi:hypothetical protein
MIARGFGFKVRWPVLLLVLLATTTTTWGQRNGTEADTPVFGIGAQQVFRFALAAVADSDRNGEAGPRCVATLGFRDTENRPFGPSMNVDLGRGDATFLDLDARSIGLRGRQRMDFRPILDLAPGSGVCEAAFSILGLPAGGSEGGGFSSFFESSETFEPSCPGSNDWGVLTLPFGFGQTLQATVVRSSNPVDVNNAPLPCDVTLNIGKGPLLPVASLVTGPLAPGQAKAVSVPFGTLGLPFGETAFLGQEVIEFPTQVHYPGFEEPCPVTSSIGCKISYQVIGSNTLLTELIWAAQRLQNDQ